MDKNDVAATLSSLSYRPGWTFGAYPLNGWEADLMGGDVAFAVSCATVNTDREQARKGYPETRTLAWQETLNASDYPDREALLSSVFGWLMMIELHESREFFRVKSDDYAAPFHPHREDGNAAWDRRLARQFG